VNFLSPHLITALGVGLITGLFSGAFGIGGGTVSTPLLRLTMDLSPHVAVGTTLALIIPTSLAATFNYIRKKEIDLRMGFTMVPLAVLGVVLGAMVTKFVLGATLMLSFAAFVLIAGLDLTFGVVYKLFKRSDDGGPSSLDETEAEKLLPLFKRMMTKRSTTLATIGLFAGFLAGFFGVGGGFIFVPCLIYFFKMPIKAAFGTSLLVVASISLPGTIMHYTLGHVDFHLMLSMMCGSIPGSFIGSALALKLKDSWLRRGFGFVMLCVAAGLAANEVL